MGEVKIPLYIQGSYCILSLEAPPLSSEQTKAAATSTIDLDELEIDIKRRLEVFG